jgi:hypothetical protein
LTTSTSAILWLTGLGLSAITPVVVALPLMAAAPTPPHGPAASARDFLNSMGVNTHVDQAYDANSYVDPLKYLGIRQVRDGARNVASDVMIAQKTGVHFTLTGGGDLKGLIASGEVLAKAGALLALEGPNEPNNFPITYDGKQGGGFGHSWVAVARFQADLYAAVKANPLLKPHPVFGPSETGAETDDVGLQFATIPTGDPASFPAGTRFFDDANVHNYVSGTGGHGGTYGDNQAWNAADPTLNDRWDGLYGNSGLTWFRHFRGYSKAQLQSLPRVTTETGWDTTTNAGGERTQGTVLTNTYLAQFKRGWSYTFVYELRDGEGGTGDQGLYHGMTPKASAVFIHTLTTILADDKSLAAPGVLTYAIAQQPGTVHDLLLQKSTGAFDLVVWDERRAGEDRVTVTFPAAHKLVKVYDITAGTDPTATLRDATLVPLTLSDHAVILEITD